MQSVTIYQAAQIINKLFEKNEISRKVTPNNLYNDRRTGRLVVNAFEENGHWCVVLEDVKVLFEHYKSNAKTRKNYDELADLVNEM